MFKNLNGIIQHHATHLKMNLVLTVIFVFSSLFAAANSDGVKRFYIYGDNFREIKSNFTWPLNIIDTDFYNVESFTVKQEVTLPNEELLRATWLFELKYAYQSGVMKDTVLLSVKYRRAGPLVACQEIRGSEYYISGSDGWNDVWDNIIVRANLVTFKGNETKVVRFQTLSSGSVHYEKTVEKNPSGSSCRNIRENILTWYNDSKHFDELLGTDSDRDEILRIKLQFQIQYISQVDNTEAIQKYNAAVGSEKLN